MVNEKPFAIKIPENIKASLEGQTVRVVGPKGELLQSIDKAIHVAISDSEILLRRISDDKRVRALHGLTKSLLTNAIHGVQSGFSKTLELSGVGYRAAVLGDELTLSVGFSHPVSFKAPKGITFSVSENKITVSGIDKHLVGQLAHQVRAVRPPEPYKGKGIKYEGERIRRKAGKAAAKTIGAK